MTKLNIPNGGYGKTRDGRKVGPLFHDRFISLNEMFYRGTEENEGGWFQDGRAFRDGKERPEDLIAEWTEGPVRTVTRTVEDREVVLGQFSRVNIIEHDPDDLLTKLSMRGWYSPAELKAAAAVLLELAGALE